MTGEFQFWWDSLDEAGQAVVERAVALLGERGVGLGDPHTKKIHGSKHPHMRELRMQDRGHPLRALYAFDPLRVAIVLVGGDKTGDEQFYRRMTRRADRLYDGHIEALRRQGLL